MPFALLRLAVKLVQEDLAWPVPLLPAPAFANGALRWV